MGRMTVAASLAQGAWAARRQWQALPREQQARLQTLLRQSGGRPGNLSAGERRELQMLRRELNLGAVLRDTAMKASSRRGFRR